MTQPIELVVIGGSAGAIEVLRDVLRQLPGKFGSAIATKKKYRRRRREFAEPDISGISRKRQSVREHADILMGRAV